jgi:putative SOS response-associated peptidase YedK
LTKEASGQMISIHDRMPVILKQDQISEWLSPDTDPAKMVHRSVCDLVIEKAAG